MRMRMGVQRWMLGAGGWEQKSTSQVYRNLLVASVVSFADAPRFVSADGLVELYIMSINMQSIDPTLSLGVCPRVLRSAALAQRKRPVVSG